jgi:hypothetical protein
MKKITIIVSVVCLMSSCGIQFGDYERWKEIHRGGTCEVEEVDERDYEFTSVYNNCENCDEVD